MGKEWSVHKYIDKVKTKSGKIRYIYDNAKYTAANHLAKSFGDEWTSGDIDYTKKLKSGTMITVSTSTFNPKAFHESNVRKAGEAFIRDHMYTIANTPSYKISQALNSAKKVTSAFKRETRWTI